MLEGHDETVTVLRWFRDDSGFISGGLDKQIIIWVATARRQHLFEAHLLIGYRGQQTALVEDGRMSNHGPCCNARHDAHGSCWTLSTPAAATTFAAAILIGKGEFDIDIRYCHETIGNVAIIYLF
jgi:hypothetical protein